MTVQLCSCRRRIWVSLDKARIKESHTTLGEIVGLHNCEVADITPQRERMITYDVVCRKLPRLAQLRHNQTVGKFPRKVNHQFSKKFETNELCTFSISL